MVDTINKYSELDDHKISTRTQLHYFIQRYKITPIKAHRLDLLLGERLLEKANEFANGFCFRCDGELDAANISYNDGKYVHGECPKVAYQKAEITHASLAKFFRNPK